MAYRKIAGVVFLLFMAFSGLALDFSVRNSCTNSEPMVSLNNTSGGTIGGPNYSENLVCADQVSYFEIRESCRSNENFILSMYDLNNSRISMYEEEYTYQLCAQNLGSAVRDSCRSNEVKALSVTSENNTNVASPIYTDTTYDMSLCITQRKPQNVTLELSGISGNTYTEDGEIPVSDSISSPINYGYIIEEQPKGIVGYGSVIRIARPENSILSLTQTADSGTFLLPFTKGGITEVQDKKNSIIENTFLNRISPSFGFEQNQDPKIKVRYVSPHQLQGFNEKIRWRSELSIKNTGLKADKLQISMESK